MRVLYFVIIIMIKIIIIAIIAIVIDDNMDERKTAY